MGVGIGHSPVRGPWNDAAPLHSIYDGGCNMVRCAPYPQRGQQAEQSGLSSCRPYISRRLRGKMRLLEMSACFKLSILRVAALEEIKKPGLPGGSPEMFLLVTCACMHQSFTSGIVLTLQ
eukprot:scaffold107588_cov19-Tisochrysis_lutea.AAC.3